MTTEAELDTTQSNGSNSSLQECRYIRSMWYGERVTKTSMEQREVEESVFIARHSVGTQGLVERGLRLHRERHVSWLLRGIEYLPSSYQSLSALQTWIAFWILHSLDVLGATIPDNVASRVVSFLRKCRDERQGGFGGGPGQQAHMASTYAATAALCTLATEDAFAALDVDALHRFVREMKNDSGSFRVSKGGESDVRAMYCALCVASLTGILDKDPSLMDGCSEYVQCLQAFDGGIGGEPGNEAHGGNTYCGVATMVLIGKLPDLNCDAILDWAAMRQMSFEGGFQGRTNKLVDSCYSFWVGCLFPLLASKQSESPYNPVDNDFRKDSPIAGLFDGESLQKYILQCAQVRRGGFRDKPEATEDYLHTCYALSGLSLAQQYGGALVTEESRVRPTDPVYNICCDKALQTRAYFSR